MHDSICSLLETVTNPHVLNQTQILVLQQVWEGRTYAQIAEEAGYSLDYIKTIGSELCQWLSEIFGKPVNKRNLKSIVTDGLRQHRHSQPHPVVQVPERQDWGEAIDTAHFVGRCEEQATLKTWLVDDRCRLVSVFGMAGVGKTALTVHVAEQLQTQFEFVFWRSLRNTPDITVILADLIHFLSGGQEASQPIDLNDQLRLVLTYLQQHRCLIVLDNWESVLFDCSDQSHPPMDSLCGSYRPGFAGYGHWLRVIGENRHQSCLMMTSRELPIGLAARESDQSAVRVLKLKGLQLNDATALVSRMHLAGSPKAWEQLVYHYSSNSLALKISTVAIRDLFDRNIDRFLKQNVLMFGEISHFLTQQLDRLSQLELQLLYDLANYGDGVTLEQLQCSPRKIPTRAKLLELLHSLQRRAMLEREGDRFFVPCILQTLLCNLSEVF